MPDFVQVDFGLSDGDVRPWLVDVRRPFLAQIPEGWDWIWARCDELVVRFTIVRKERVGC